MTMTKFFKAINQNILYICLVHISPKNLWRKAARGNLNYFELLFIMFLVYLIINSFIYLSVVTSLHIDLGENIFKFDTYYNTIIPVINSQNSWPRPFSSPSPTPNNSPNPSPPSTPKPAPNPKPKLKNATKAIAAVGVVALGLSAIIVTNSASKIANIIKFSQLFSNTDWYANLSSVFNFTAYSALDTLGLPMLVF